VKIPRCADVNSKTTEILSVELIEVVNFIAFSNSNVTGSGTGTLGGVILSVLNGSTSGQPITIY
jgi:hypothetical protein